MDEELIKKLRFLPRHELIRILNKVYPSKSFQKHMINTALNKNIRKVDSFLKNSHPDKIIELISKSDSTIPEELINELYNEYLNGLNPTLFLAEILRPFNYGEIEQKLDLILESLDKAWKNKEPKYKNFRKASFSKISNVFEIIISYDARLDYSATDQKIPKSVYDNRNLTLWVSEKNNSFIINTKDWALPKSVQSSFETIFKTQIIFFRLEQDIVNNIFGEDSLIRGNYFTSTPEAEEVPNKILSSKHLLNYKEARVAEKKYNRRSSYNQIDSLGVNVGAFISSNGRISISYHFKNSNLRRWVISIIDKVITSVNKIKEEDVQRYFKNIEIDKFTFLEDIRGQEARDDFLKIISALLKNKIEGKNNISIELTINDLYRGLKKYFDFVFIPVCKCNSIGVCECSSNSFSIKGKNIEIECQQCKTIIESVNKNIKCIEGHPINGQLNEYIIAHLNPEGKSLINRTIKGMGHDLKIETNDIIKLQNNHLTIIQNTDKLIYEFDEISNFKNITPLANIPEGVLKTQYLNLKELISEKCDKHGDINCRSCVSSHNGLCIRSLVAEFVDSPQISAHSPTEYGDITFSLKIDGGNGNFVGLCKSHTGSKDNKLTSKNSPGASLLAQVIQMVFDSKVRGVAIVAGAYLESGLKANIEQLAIEHHKKVVFIAHDELARMSYEYFKKAK